MSLTVNSSGGPGKVPMLSRSKSECCVARQEHLPEVLQIDRIARLEFKAMRDRADRRFDWTAVPEAVSRLADWVGYLGPPPPGSVDEKISGLEAKIKSLLALDLNAAPPAEIARVSKELATVEGSLGEHDPEALQRSALKRYEEVHHLCTRLSGSLQAAAAELRQSSSDDDAPKGPNGGGGVRKDDELDEQQQQQQQRQQGAATESRKEGGKKAAAVAMSQEQQAITDFQGSLFLQGRSGTGKTLVITRRIGKRRRQAVADGSPLPTQLFITKSSLLKEEVLKELRSGGYPAQSLDLWPPVGLHCSTWDDLITVVGRCAPEVKPATINYERFLSSVWRNSATASRELPPHMVWAEFNTRLRPFRPAWASPAPTAGEYKMSDLSAIGVRLEPEDQVAMYEDFIRYTKWKESEHYQDDVDVAVLLRRHCCGLGLVDELYIDEAQDFSPAQLMALISLCSRPDGVTVAGDTCQTINPGSAFSFQEIRQAFVLHWDANSAWGEHVGEALEEEESALKKASADIAAQCGMFTLRYNYRCAAGVADLAGSTVKLLLRRFPGAADYVEEETCLSSQPTLPIFVQLPQSFAADCIMGVGGSRIPWLDPTKIVVLVRNDAARHQLREHRDGVKGTILTVAEAKGLEFDLVILCGLLGDCDHSDLWKLADDSSAVSRAVFVATTAPDFRAVARMGFKTHRMACRMVQGISEFKSLYVAITRAKMGCAFLECGSDSIATPLIERWSKSGLLKLWSGRKEYEAGVETSLNETNLPSSSFSSSFLGGAAAAVEGRGDVASELRWIQMEMVRRQGAGDKEARAMLSKERQRVQASGIADDRFRHRFWQYFGGAPSQLSKRGGASGTEGNEDDEEVEALQAQIAKLEQHLRSRGDKQAALSALTSLLLERDDGLDDDDDKSDPRPICACAAEHPSEAAAASPHTSQAMRTSCVAMMVLPLLEFVCDHLADKSKNVAVAAELLTTSCLECLDAEVIGATLPKLFARCRSKPKAGERLLRIAVATIEKHGNELGYHATAAAVLEAERLVMDLREEVRLASQRCLESVIHRAEHVPRILGTSNWPGLKAKLFQYIRELEQWTFSHVATTSAADLALLLLVIEKNVRYQDAGGRLLQNLCASPIAGAAKEAIELLQPTLTKHGLLASAEAISGLKRGSNGGSAELPSLVPALEKYFRSGGGRAGDDLGSKLQDLMERGSQLHRHASDDPRERWAVFAEAHQIFVQARSLARVVFNTQVCSNNGRRAAPTSKISPSMDMSWRAQVATLLEMSSWKPTWRSNAPCRKVRSLHLWFNIFSFLSADWDTLCLIAERVVDHVTVDAELRKLCITTISAFHFERANHEAAPLAREDSLQASLNEAASDLQMSLERMSKAGLRRGRPSEESVASLLQVISTACELQEASVRRAELYTAAGRGFLSLRGPLAADAFTTAAHLLSRSLTTLEKKMLSSSPLRTSDVHQSSTKVTKNAVVMGCLLRRWRNEPVFQEKLGKAAAAASVPMAKTCLKRMIEDPVTAYNELLAEMRRALAVEASMAADLRLRSSPAPAKVLASAAQEGRAEVRRILALYQDADRRADAGLCAAVLGDYKRAFQFTAGIPRIKRTDGLSLLLLSSAALGLQ